jgi:transcription initiation factor TFIIB
VELSQSDIPSSQFSATTTNCPACINYKKAVITDPDSVEIVCSGCGIVILDKMQENNYNNYNNKPEWNTFSVKETNAKCSTSISISVVQHEMGFAATIIGNNGRHASGHKIDAETRYRIYRLRAMDYRTQSSSDRNLRQAFNKLDVLKHKIGLSNAAVEKSAYNLQKSSGKRICSWKNVSSVMAAAVYVTCREMEIARTINDVTSAANIRWKVLSRTIRQLLVELDYKVPNTNPTNCLVTIANKLNISEKTKRQAINMMNEVARNEILSAGKDPMGLAAAVLYLSCIRTSGNGRENISLVKISKTAGITDATLRNRFKDIKHQLRLN